MVEEEVRKRSVTRPSGPFSSGRLWKLLLVAALIPVLGLYGRSVAEQQPVEAAGPSEPVETVRSVDVDSLLERARATRRALREAESYYEREVQPIERVLLQYRSEPVLVRRIALALVRQARRVELEPRLLLAVLLVENPMLEPSARSPVGARGLMQIMPLHRGHWKGCTDDLITIESNICYGASIFAHYLRREGGNVERALLRYNGCVKGTNTPNCHMYPTHVYARAGRASILAWLKPQPARGAAP